MKRHLTTVILLLLAVGLGVYLWVDRDKVTAGEKQRRENNVFSAWRREDLSRIEIQHEGETIVIVKANPDSPWRMTAPSEERVDQAAAERLITTLEFATRVRKVAETTNLGLESPRAKGSIAMGGLVLKWSLGAASPRPEGSSYFKLDDEPAAFVVSKELADALLAHADGLRDRTVIPYLSLELARFEVKAPQGAGFVVTRTDERSFQVEGSRLLASRVTLDKVWGALAEMRAEAFPKNADADRLTQNPRLTILMTSKEPGKPPGELVIGDACPDHPNDVVVLRKSPTRVAACAPKGALETLLGMTPDMLVDRRPFSFRHDEIEEIRFEANGTPAIELARRGTGFHQREPEDRELTKDEAEAASDLLKRIEHGEATEIRPSGDAAEEFESVGKAKVRAGAHEELVEVGAWSSTKDTTVVLKRIRDNARLTVPVATARRLLARKTTTKPHLMVSGETRPVKRLVLRCGEPQELVDNGTGLKLVEPKGYETDGQITQLVDAIFRGGKVIAWVADSDDGSFGIKPDGCRLVAAFEDNNNPLTIHLGADGEGGVYGSIDGKREVFVVGKAFAELARRIYVNRAAMRVDPQQIESVKASVNGKPVTLKDNTKLGSFYADRVASLGAQQVAQPEVELTISLSEGGPTKRIACSKAEGAWRKCSTPSVKAIFEVPAAMVDGLFGVPSKKDAGD